MVRLIALNQLGQLGESQVELTHIFIYLPLEWREGTLLEMLRFMVLMCKTWDQVGVVEGRKYTIFSGVLVHCKLLRNAKVQLQLSQHIQNLIAEHLVTLIDAAMIEIVCTAEFLNFV